MWKSKLLQFVHFCTSHNSSKGHVRSVSAGHINTLRRDSKQIISSQSSLYPTKTQTVRVTPPGTSQSVCADTMTSLNFSAILKAFK